MRKFAQLNVLKPGVSKLETDGSIPCIRPGQHTVWTDEKARLYVECNCGQHWLDGQLDNDYTTLVGLYLCDSPVAA